MGICHNIHIYVTFNLYLKLCKIPRQDLHSQARGIFTSQENTGIQGTGHSLSAVSTGSPFYLTQSASEGLPRLSSPHVHLLHYPLPFLPLCSLPRVPVLHVFVPPCGNSHWIRLFSPHWGNRLRAFRMEHLWNHVLSSVLITPHGTNAIC